MSIKDTIAAIATPIGTAALAIIRVSGSESIINVNQIFKGKDLTKVKGSTVHYGHIIDDNQIVDEVVVTVFKNPKSFTGEDLVEITTHGGILVTQKVLETILKTNTRLANPGEFSQRAYLNQKIDLIQAESIMDIISATNDQALRLANQSLNKQTSNLIKTLKNEILSMISVIEVNIDYPEYDDTELVTTQTIAAKVDDLIEKINHILINSQKSQLIHKGIKTAIIGKPNVGKSSLLNALIGESRAIVSDIAGTTRDTIDVVINLAGVTLNLIDTAGIRHSTDVIENIGIKRAKEMIESADLILLVLDASQPLDQYDQELLTLTQEKSRIIIGNKKDLNQNMMLNNMLLISTYTKEGLNTLESEILKITKLDNFNDRDFNYLSNVRHIAKLKNTYQALLNVKANANLQTVVDILGLDLRTAYNELGDILGDNNYEGLLNELFSKFCLGK